MIILDIKNVFNSAHGRGIIEALCKIYNTKKKDRDQKRSSPGVRLKYHGVRFDKNMTKRTRIIRIVTRANKTVITNLCRLMPNVCRRRKHQKA